MCACVYQITSDRLANQVPLIVQYHMLDQYFSQLQTAMLSMIGSQNAEKLIREDSGVAQRRKSLSQRLERLRTGRKLLSKFLLSHNWIVNSWDNLTFICFIASVHITLSLMILQKELLFC